MHRAVVLSWLALTCVGAQTAPFDASALLSLERLSDSRLSPDGSRVAYAVTRVDVPANKKLSDIYVVPTAGGSPVRLTTTGDNSRPVWSPDSAKITFVSTRGGDSQIWSMSPDGTGQRQITSFATGAEGQLYSPDGKYLVFVSEVYPECGGDNACNQQKLQGDKESKVKARIYTSLLYRHWTEWRTPRRKHLLQFTLATGAIRDLTPPELETPPFSLGGPDDYAISPDGSEIAFVSNPDPKPALSTNSEIYTIGAYPEMPESKPLEKITTNPGADNSPGYSPDGRYLAWRSQLRAGYESDRWRLIVHDRQIGYNSDLTQALDRSVSSFTWSPDSQNLFYTTEDRARQGVNMISVRGGASRGIVVGHSYVDDMQFTPDGKAMVYSESTATRPAELFRVYSTGGAPEPLTRLNTDRLESYKLRGFEEFYVNSFDQTRVHSLLVKPPDFSEARKYPVLFLLHGGPQGAWGENWSYRWNPQVFASAGFVVVMPNPRGSTGYGQGYTDAINADWGGKVYDDIQSVISHVELLPYVDRDRMAAAGGSFGGYMVNWMLGHDSRFKAYISHAGVYDLPSMFGATEELWFPLWEFGGPPWDRPDVYSKFSPSQYVRFFRTPTLVIHGELDYRVPYTQGLQLFTALQMMDVPSKLLVFPDEGHWILKPQNSLLWYKTFVDWARQWTKPGEPVSSTTP